jgi:integrative and conjugative element protein (TIGR02256 family)
MIVDRVSADGRYGLFLDEPVVARLRRYCLASGDRETGGILAGSYNSSHTMAAVTKVSGPPPGSVLGRSTFVRAVGHLQKWLDDLWREGRAYYLGEWHFHPRAAPTPSRTDRDQMRAIAEDPKYACPEPVLLIVGGFLQGGLLCSTNVFMRGGTMITLGDQVARTSSHTPVTGCSRSGRRSEDAR